MRKFKVYADEDRNVFWVVYFFRSKPEMWYHRRRIEKFYGIENLGNNFEACASYLLHPESYGAPDTWKSKQVGILMFYAGYIGGGVVTHEWFHATSYFFQRLDNSGFNLSALETNKEADERFAWLIGENVRRFWWKFYGHGIDVYFARFK